MPLRFELEAQHVFCFSLAQFTQLTGEFPWQPIRNAPLRSISQSAPSPSRLPRNSSSSTCRRRFRQCCRSIWMARWSSSGCARIGRVLSSSLTTDSREEADSILKALPLGQADLLRFELIAIGPLTPSVCSPGGVQRCVTRGVKDGAGAAWSKAMRLVKDWDPEGEHAQPGWRVPAVAVVRDASGSFASPRMTTFPGGGW